MVQQIEIEALVERLTDAGYRPLGYNERPREASMFIDFPREMKLSRGLFKAAIDQGYVVSGIMHEPSTADHDKKCIRVWFEKPTTTFEMEMI